MSEESRGETNKIG